MSLDRAIKETNQRIDTLMAKEGSNLGKISLEEADQNGFISWTQNWVNMLKYAFDGPSQCRGRMRDLYYPTWIDWTLPWE